MLQPTSSPAEEPREKEVLGFSCLTNVLVMQGSEGSLRTEARS